MPHKAKCKVFISYSRHDEEVVKPLAGLLAGVTAKPIFLDIESIKPGDLWKSDIENAVRDSEVFILCWCCLSEQSEFVKREIRLAVRIKGKRLIPVLFCSVPLPDNLADRQWVDMRGHIAHTCNSRAHSLLAERVENVEEARSRDGVRAQSDDEKYMPRRASHAPALLGLAVGAFFLVLGAWFALFLGQRRPVPRDIPPIRPVPPVEHYYSNWLLPLFAVLLIAVCGLLLYRYRKRRREREVDEVAHQARQYFETLRSG